ncbi:hypothetical protein DBR42_02745 [Pelomonas sp. HMWF004]|nr:hypothetical protein DBR42_02745 [Pelomonas sp. HMWF004]
MQRRNFVLATVGGAAAMGPIAAAASQKAPPPADDRAYMAGLLRKMAEPVLSRMAEGQLKASFPVEVSPTWDGRPRSVAYMECFARLMAGVAPWLSLPEDGSPEGLLRRSLTQHSLQAFTHAVDPASPDYLHWRSGSQPLVDSAYFTNALMRAPRALWDPLDAATKARIANEIKLLRRVSPPYTNWLLFAAMNEVFLLMIGEEWDPMRVGLTLKKLEEWYVGDGWVADGPVFHFDYYNSFVIYPMLVEMLEVLAALKPHFNNIRLEVELPKWLKRMQRHAEHLERLVSPTGTYPPIGRSLTYRTAAFQPLALLAWRKMLPQTLPEGQVRAALMAVHRAVFSDASNFTADGHLTIGFVGRQPELGDRYSNNGSMYITAASFLALGLPATDSFWTAPAQDWTQKKAFSGQKFPKDYAVDY